MRGQPCWCDSSRVTRCQGLAWSSPACDTEPQVIAPRSRRPGKGGHSCRARARKKTPPVGLWAIGGWGSGQMSPFSPHGPQAALFWLKRTTGCGFFTGDGTKTTLCPHKFEGPVWTAGTDSGDLLTHCSFLPPPPTSLPLRSCPPLNDISVPFPACLSSHASPAPPPAHRWTLKARLATLDHI